MNTPEGIDRLFREETERLAEIRPNTSFDKDRFWQHLEHRLEPQKSKKSGAFWYRVAAGLLLLSITTLFGWKLYTQQQELNAYAAALKELKKQEIQLVEIPKIDTVFINSVVTADKADTFVKKKNRQQAIDNQIPDYHSSTEKQRIETPVLMPYRDSSTQIAIQQGIAHSQKPFRVVPQNKLPHPIKEMPETQDVYVKAERQHSPKLTISLTPKTDQ